MDNIKAEARNRVKSSIEARMPEGAGMKAVEAGRDTQAVEIPLPLIGSHNRRTNPAARTA